MKYLNLHTISKSIMGRSERARKSYDDAGSIIQLYRGYQSNLRNEIRTETSHDRNKTVTYSNEPSINNVRQVVAPLGPGLKTDDKVQEKVREKSRE